jgi:hypothetical protein
MNNTDDNTKTAASCLMIVRQAISQPGLIHEAYHRFHGYSLRNQLLAMFQCTSRRITPGSLATYRRWERLGRHVVRGQKALVLCVPITIQDTDTNALATDDTKMVFVYRARWFVLSQTEGTLTSRSTCQPGAKSARSNRWVSRSFRSLTLTGTCKDTQPRRETSQSTQSRRYRTKRPSTNSHTSSPATQKTRRFLDRCVRSRQKVWRSSRS